MTGLVSRFALLAVLALGACDDKPPAKPAAPVPGKTVNIGVRKGRIFVKIPPSKKFIELKDPRQIPVGSTIDAPTRGVTTVPPLAMAPYMTAACSGVTATSPCPIEKFAASPGRSR